MAMETKIFLTAIGLVPFALVYASWRTPSAAGAGAVGSILLLYGVGAWFIWATTILLWLLWH